MQRLISVTLIVSTLFIQTAIAGNTHQAVTESEVMTLLNNWKKAYATKDTALLNKVLDDSWIYSGGADGKTANKQDNLRELITADYTIANMVFSDMEIRYYDNIAVVTARETLHIKGGDGKMSYVDLRFTDVYRKENGELRAISTHSSPIAN